MPKDTNPPKTYPLSIRLSAAQRAFLEKKAGAQPLGEYIRAKAMDDTAYDTHQLLGELGRTKIAENLNSLSKSAKLGMLILTPEESAVLVQACADIAAIRQMLLRALGHRISSHDH
jgi:hypothetical protein